MTTRAQAEIYRPNPKYTNLAQPLSKEPRNIPSALSHPGWKAAMTALTFNKIWTLEPRHPHMNVVGCK